MKLKKSIIPLLLSIPAIVACLYWYDWKLLIIIFALSWANNIMIAQNISNLNKTKTNGKNS